MTTSVSKDVEFYCASFDLYEKFVGVCPPMRTPTQKFKNGFSMFCSQEMSSGLVSFPMIFEALQSELLSFKLHSLNSKILKIPEFNLAMKEHAFKRKH